MLFNNPKDLLNLYNAVNGTNYSNHEDLEINTLENAIFMSMKNDISFIFEFSLNLYEHQSSNNPNMPLRNLFYIASLLEKSLVGYKDASIYSSSTISIPTPNFIVFYNGEDKNLPEISEYKLSDLFSKKTNRPNLELYVTVLNINKDMSYNIKENCKKLKDYCTYVDTVRSYKKDYPLDVAVDKAIDHCIKNNILADFLLKQRAEVKSMSILEYNAEIELEKIKNAERKSAFLEGEARGIELGIELGETNHTKSLIQKKLEKNKPIEQIANELETSVEEIERYINELKASNN